MTVPGGYHYTTPDGQTVEIPAGSTVEVPLYAAYMILKNYGDALRPRRIAERLDEQNRIAAQNEQEIENS
jgi:hypothetical protein